VREKSDLVFAENKNQWAPWVRYMGDLKKGKLILEQNKISFLINDNQHYEHVHKHTPEPPINAYLLRIAFKGANMNAAVVPTEKQVAYRNYFIGNNPAYWASEVHTYSVVTYKDIYPGIDAEVYGSGDDLKYQFRVHAGADASQIALQYEGAMDMRIRDEELQYKTTVGDFRELAPVAYQSGDEKSTIKCRYKLDQQTQTVTFDLQNYDHSRELVIDPTLVFASYTGSTADNWGFTAAYDNAGNFYAGGIVFPYTAYVYVNSGTGTYPTTAGAFQTSYSAGSVAAGDTSDIVITKFNPSGSQLIYSTYLGGNGSDRPHSLIVNSNNELYILGSTTSTNFPVTAGTYDANYHGAYDIIITKMNVNGTALAGSTYVGGSGDDGYNLDPFFTYNYGDEVRGEIVLDSLSNVYVASCTKSSNFPVSSGAFQTTIGGGLDGCVFKMNSNLTSMLWCSYLGGSASDAAYSLKLDLNKNLVITGPTGSSNFRATTGSLHAAYLGGDCDGYVCKVSNDGSTLQASSFIGTSSHDQCFFVEVDAQNEIYLIGQSLGSYPILNAGYSNNGGNQFVQVLSNNLSTSVRSTVFGVGQGQVDISPTAFLVDKCYNIYVAGWGGNVNSLYYNPSTGSTAGLPLTSNAYQSTTDGSDMYFIVFDRNLAGLLYATYYGGNGPVGEHVDGGTCRFDKNGTIYSAVCSGCDANSMFPTTPGAWSNTNRSQNCNYSALKFQMNLAGTNVAVQAYPRATGCVPLTVQFNSILTNVQNVKWDFGDNNTSTVANPNHTYMDTGTYHVMLVGIDSSSCNITDTAYVDVWVRNDSLSANFSDSVLINCYTRQITLSASNYPSTQFLWNFGDGTTSTTPGTVSHTYTSAGTYTVSLTVTDSTKCNLQASYSQQIICPEVVRLALHPNDTVGCIPLTINFGNSTNSNGQYHWDFGNGDTSNLRNPSYTYTHGGYYTVTLSMYDPTTCNKTDTLILHVTAIDSSADASFSVSRRFYHCDSVDITVRSSYVGATWQSWNFGDGFTSTANPVSHRYRGAISDTITHIIYDSTKICKPYDTAMIIVSLTPLHVSLSVPDTLGCLPFTPSLLGVSPLLTTQYYWYFPGGTTAVGNPVTHTFAPVGTYTVLCVAVDSNACVNLDSNYATIHVIDDSVRAHFQIQILNSCDSNLSINLINTSTNAVQYFWNFGNGNTSTATNPSQQYTLPGTYTIELLAIDTTRCHPRDSAYATVTLKPNVSVDFTLANICLGSTEAFVNLSDSNAKFQWQFGDGSTSTLYSPTHTYLTDGTYTVRLTIIDTSTCNVYDTLRKSITVYAQPIAAFSPVMDTFMFETPLVFTNNSQHYNTSIWHFGDGDSSIENSPTHIYDHTIGWQRVCLDVYNQGAPCFDTICNELFINFVELIGVPNAFSPNGDGINDMVRVEGKGIIKLEFRIYNRWGQQVFFGTDQRIGWDGIFNGEPQPMEVYTYTVDALLIDGHHVPLKGNITLLR
jgi:gliding motility-associated-like protein